MHKYNILIHLKWNVPHYESEFQSWLMSHSYILRTRHILLHTGHFFLHTGCFLLQDSYQMTITMVIRWFKFTLKPPNSMAWRNFFWAIWDTSHWNFLSNLDSRHLMTSPRTLLGQFWHMSIFGDSRAVQVICQKKIPSENQFFSMKERQGIKVSWGCKWADT